ncbi:MAG: manganese efflux pump MntP family protein [Desulfarculales bacterium]|nr:manganese efflux pump MntP family protein [Desulfarculales bacterium]
MDIFTIFGIALALAMDAFAVSLAAGIRLPQIRTGQVIRMAAVFGGFQFLMPVGGWLLGITAHKFIAAYDHWLAFALLALVGGRMLKEAWDNRSTPQDAPVRFDPTQGLSLLVLGLATSLDALAVGISLAFLGVAIWTAAAVIGIVCFTMTMLALRLGKLICRLPSFSQPGNKAGALGGVVLLAIGFRILYEHGVF